MAKGQKAVPVDGYTYNLLQQAVDDGIADNLADAILHGISSYLGVTYKSRKERKLEQEAARIQQLATEAGKQIPIQREKEE